VVGLGLLMLIIAGNSGYPGNSFPTSLIQIINGLIAFKPYAVILTGLLILILTPVFRVGISIVTFLKEKDYLYVIITSIVFIILIISFLLGKGE
jgi:Predicted membrane protein